MASIGSKSLFTLSFLALAACGTDVPKGKACFTEPADPGAAENVTVATRDQIDAAAVLPASYLVAFRRQGGGPGLGFRSFAAEQAAHGAFLSDEIGTDPRLANIRFITSLDLSRPEHDESSGFKASTILPSPLMRLAWSEDALEPMVATLAQLDFVTASDAADALHEWEARGLLWYAEPNYVSRLSQTTPGGDTKFGKLATAYDSINYWWLQKIKIGDAYRSIAARDQSDGSAPTDEQMEAGGPIVAILDSGVDYEHPALKDRIWVNADQNAAGCTGDLHGCNTTVATTKSLGNGDVWPFDTTGPGQTCFGRDNNCSHGTHVAGIVAADNAWADQDNRVAAGICPTCKLMILKIVSKVGKDSGILDSSIIAAFKYLSRFQEKGTGAKAVRLINASFGKFVRSRSVGLLVRLLREKNNTLLIGAAGNEDTLTMEFPAAFNDAVAVAAVDQELRKVSFSNFGRWVDVAAPGSGILSTVPGAEIDAKSGTSMAAPVVAGIAGLVLSRFPGLSYSDLRSAIEDGADPEFYSKASGGGYNYDCYYAKVPQEAILQPLLGTGLVNAAAAINRTPSENLPLFSKLDRVRPGCSVVRAGARPSQPLSLAVLAALPLLAAAFYSLQLNRAMLRKRRSSPSRLP